MMLPTPARWLFTPVINIARVGAQFAATWKLLKRTPLLANVSKLGVLISLP